MSNQGNILDRKFGDKRMSLPVVKQILIEVSTDVDIRNRYFNDIDNFLSYYELTEEEKQCLRENANEDSLQNTVSEIEKEVVSTASDIRL